VRRAIFARSISPLEGENKFAPIFSNANGVEELHTGSNENSKVPPYRRPCRVRVWLRDQFSRSLASNVRQDARSGTRSRTGKRSEKYKLFCASARRKGPRIRATCRDRLLICGRCSNEMWAGTARATEISYPPLPLIGAPRLKASARGSRAMPSIRGT